MIQKLILTHIILDLASIEVIWKILLRNMSSYGFPAFWISTSFDQNPVQLRSNSSTSLRTQSPFVIKHDNTVGRYVVTDTDLKPEDFIFTESAFAFGPKSDSPPLCLGCCIPVDCTILCSSCKWPVCGKDCETNPAHKNAECRVFTKAKAHFQEVPDTTQTSLQYECVTPLRVLLAKLRNNDRWIREVKNMEAHNLERKNTCIWKFNQINIVNYLRGPCQLKIFDEDLIHTVCGILECNAFEARSKSGYPIRCLFPKLALLSHSCISNIVHTIVSREDTKFEVAVRAAVEVNKGEELFSSYTYALWPTLVRRRHLRDGKFFFCMCNRCCDSTEMGTHLSSLICNECNIGVITSKDASVNSDWECSSCGFLLTNATVDRIFTQVQNEIDTIDTDYLDGLIEKYANILHPHNSYIIAIKLQLIPRYRRTNVHKAIHFCKDVLHVLNIIEPGCTRIRATTLYELALAILTSIILYQKQSPTEVINKELQNAIKCLKEAVPILAQEPEYSAEGKFGKIAMHQLEYLINHSADIVSGRKTCSTILTL